MSVIEIAVMVYGLIALTTMVVVMSLREGENAAEVAVQVAMALLWLPCLIVVAFALAFDAAVARRRR